MSAFSAVARILISSFTDGIGRVKPVLYQLDLFIYIVNETKNMLKCI